MKKKPWLDHCNSAMISSTLTLRLLSIRWSSELTPVRMNRIYNRNAQRSEVWFRIPWHRMQQPIEPLN